MDDIAEGRTS